MFLNEVNKWNLIVKCYVFIFYFFTLMLILFVFTVALMIISMISIVYGALVCSVLAIQIKYDDYKVRMKPIAYLCMILWRGLEIATRITTLVLFSTALTVWVVLVGLTNLFIFFFQPWVEFWARKTSLPENIEKNFSKLGTTVVLCMVTFLYACINIFCWSAVQLDLADHDLVEKQPRGEAWLSTTPCASWRMWPSWYCGTTSSQTSMNTYARRCWWCNLSCATAWL